MMLKRKEGLKKSNTQNPHVLQTPQYNLVHLLRSYNWCRHFSRMSVIRELNSFAHFAALLLAFFKRFVYLAFSPDLLRTFPGERSTRAAPKGWQFSSKAAQVFSCFAVFHKFKKILSVSFPPTIYRRSELPKKKHEEGDKNETEFPHIFS